MMAKCFVKQFWTAQIFRGVGRFLVILTIGVVRISAQQCELVQQSELPWLRNVPHRLFEVQPIEPIELRRHYRERDLNNVVSVAEKVKIDFNSSSVFALENQEVVFGIQILAAGATSLAFHFSEFMLPSGSYLYVRDNEDGVAHIRKFSSRNNKHSEQMTVAGVQSNLAILELHCPKSSVENVRLTIDRVYKYFDNDAVKQALSFPTSKMANDVQRNYGGAEYDCHIPINCREGWNWCVERDGVALLETFGDEESRICTATLVNTTQNSRKPYLMTAWHCLNGGSPTECDLDEDDIDDILNFVAVFKWYSDDCTGSYGTYLESFAGLEFVMAHRASDVALLRILETSESGEFDPAADIPFTYAGWTRVSSGLEPGAIVHHPQGDLMKLAIPSDGIEPQGFGHKCADGDPSNSPTYDDPNYWTVKIIKSNGTLEAKSSGSALFDPVGRIAGVLSSMSSLYNCHNIYPTEACFGKISSAWDGGGTSSTRLKDWLDPDWDDRPSPISLHSFYHMNNLVRVYNKVLDGSLTFQLTDNIENLTGVGPDDLAYYIAAPTQLEIGGLRTYSTVQGPRFEVDQNVSAAITAIQSVRVTCGTYFTSRDESVGSSQSTRIRVFISKPSCRIANVDISPTYVGLLNQDSPNAQPDFDGCVSGPIRKKPLSVDDHIGNVGQKIQVVPFHVTNEARVVCADCDFYSIFDSAGGLLVSFRSLDQQLNASAISNGYYVVVGYRNGQYVANCTMVVFK
ncbi:MAG: hypothetical protein HQ472_10795 [Ignavibacteria bacterium]|nr:hypothetical protein [Ignavibacteria bacterium]